MSVICVSFVCLCKCMFLKVKTCMIKTITYLFTLLSRKAHYLDPDYCPTTESFKNKVRLVTDDKSTNDAQTHLKDLAALEKWESYWFMKNEKISEYRPKDKTFKFS